MSEKEQLESTHPCEGKEIGKEQMENTQPELTGEKNLHPKATKYIQELLAEKILLDHLKFPHAVKLIDQEIEKIESAGRAPPKESKYIDLNKNKPIRVTSRVLLPVKEYPKFNFIGKILGPKGHSLRRLQEETLCRILIQGRGSMRDPIKEQELLESLEPKYNHLADELNVEVSAVGAPAEAHARMAYALAELKQYLTPDNTDYISIEQLEQIERMRETGYSYPEKEYQSATPFKKPRAASFQPDRFYETLNKAQASIDNDSYSYAYRSNAMPYSSENYDDSKYSSSYGKYQNNFYNRQPKRNEHGGGYGSGYHRQGYGETSTRDSHYKSKPYNRPQE